MFHASIRKESVRQSILIAWMEEMDKDRLKDLLSQFLKEQEIYKSYAVFLDKTLSQAMEIYAPGAMVKTRAKSAGSFAEKAIRKNYDNPIHQSTDLCGARVITLTLQQAEVVCRFIREAFVVDEANSDDKSRLLHPSEFGYLSVHFVVQVQASKPVMGIEAPAKIKDRKAEIQVRTLLQHAWASIAHDSLYKNEFQVADAWKRQFNRLAAVLEGTDKE